MARLTAYRCLSALLLCAAAQATAQVSLRTDFGHYRDSVMADFDSYKANVYADYHRYLDSVWREFDQMKSADRTAAPKPDIIPQVEETPEVEEVNLPAPSVLPAIAVEESQAEPVAAPGKGAGNASPVTTRVDFHGIPVDVTVPYFSLGRGPKTTHDYARLWKELSGRKVASGVLPELTAKSNEMGLNPYLTFCFFKAFADSRFPGHDAGSRLLLTQYLASNAGYDVRIAVDGNGVPLILLNSAQTLYGRNYMMVDGDKYYIFSDGDGYAGGPGVTVYTCELPAGADKGCRVDFRLGQLNIPYAPQRYHVEFGSIVLDGECNANLYPLLKHYPQVPIDVYVMSCSDNRLRTEVCRQVSTALEGLDTRIAVDRLLQFVQYGFKYATDTENHGYEKPYFFEEMLFYDKCDCEDRAIFYTRLLWDVLGLRCHLLNYPGHESASVSLPDDIKGISYDFNGERYYISDPTCIGAITGQCAPDYKYMVPDIDYEYK